MDISPAPSRSWGLVLLAVLLVFAAANVGEGLYRAVTNSNDLRVRYEEWCVLTGQGERVNGFVVSAAGRQGWWLPYHPLTYMGLTPLFLAGLGPARWLFLAINLSCGVYVLRRAGQLYQLSKRQQAWLAVLFCCWPAVRVTVGQGQLGLIWLALILGAFPFATAGAAARLGLGMIKHTLVFPLYGELLLARPRRLLWPLVVALVPLVLAFVWIGAAPRDFAEQTRLATGQMLAWTGGTDFNSALAPWIADTTARQAIVWTVWAVLLVFVTGLIREGEMRLAALLLLSLLPVYHRFYDLVVALPVVAVFLQQRRHGWLILLTLALVGRQEFLVRRLPAPWPEWLGWYYPVVILLMIVGMAVADRSRGSAVANSS